MENNDLKNVIDLIDFVYRPVEKEEVLYLYKINNVNQQRVELYLDFILSLYKTVTTTHLGDDTMGGEDNQKHFNWCWQKVLNSFKLEDITFKDNEEFNTYFNEVFLEFFYEVDDKSENNIKPFLDLYIHNFTYNSIKTKSELESFFDLYKIFDKSIG